MRQFFFTIISFVFISCKKDTGINGGTGVTHLNIINAIPGSSALAANINDQLTSYKAVLSWKLSDFGLSTPYSFEGGQISLTVSQITDTANTVYSNSKLNLPNNTNHSLFLTGTIEAAESVLIADTLPSYTPYDSVTNIRFINLRVGSNPVSVNLTGSSFGSEVIDLNYKQITAFKRYPAKTSINSYSFEFRDASSGDFITTYDLTGVNNGINGNGARNTILFNNLTLVLGGTNDNPIVFVVNKWYF